MTEELRSELIALIESAKLANAEIVCDAVLSAAEAGGREAGLAELERAKANDAAAVQGMC